MGPKEQTSTVLLALEEAAIVSLRVQARLPPKPYHPWSSKEQETIQ